MYWTLIVLVVEDPSAPGGGECGDLQESSFLWDLWQDVSLRRVLCAEGRASG